VGKFYQLKELYAMEEVLAVERGGGGPTAKRTRKTDLYRRTVADTIIVVAVHVSSPQNFFRASVLSR
jgi:hypothetical protein